MTSSGTYRGWCTRQWQPAQSVRTMVSTAWPVPNRVVITGQFQSPELNASGSLSVDSLGLTQQTQEGTMVGLQFEFSHKHILVHFWIHQTRMREPFSRTYCSYARPGSKCGKHTRPAVMRLHHSTVVTHNQCRMMKHHNSLPEACWYHTIPADRKNPTIFSPPSMQLGNP